MIESAVGMFATGATAVSHGDTWQTGAFNSLAFAAVSDGSRCVQQFIAADAMQGCESPKHDAICDSGADMLPGTQVTAADVTTATMTQSATTPVARIRIAFILT